MELSLFRRLLDRTAYVGEVGLDFSRHGRDTRKRQLEVFEFVLSQPAIQHKVLTVHSRGAEADTIARLAQVSANAVLHWYSGPTRHVDAALDAGLYFSANAAMVRSKNGQRILDAIPLERLLTETDGPYTRTGSGVAAPSDVPELVRALAAHLRVDDDQMRRLLFDNMARIYARAHETARPPL